MLTVEGGLRAAVLLVRLAHPIPRLHRGKRVGYNPTIEEEVDVI